jgi:hypothetical protein
MKSLFIRCSEETYELAHSLAKKESRSLNKQIIHMIHSEADKKDIEIEDKIKVAQNGATINQSETTFESKLGLQGIVETRKQDSSD